MSDRRERWWLVVAGESNTVGRSGTLMSAHYTRDEAMAAIVTAEDGSVVVTGTPMQWAMIVDARSIIGDPPRWFLVEAGRDVDGVEESIWDGPHASLERAMAVMGGDPDGPITIQDQQWDWAGITLLDRIVLSDWYVAEREAEAEDEAENESEDEELDDVDG